MRKACWRLSLMMLATLALGEISSPFSFGAPERRRGGNFGTVTGFVRDSKGRPLAGAVVSLLRDGAEVVIKQTKSAADGSFTARVAPGRYLLRAVAEGFGVASFSAVQITPAAELVYRFNLEPVGEGRTVPERRRDRDDRKWDLRAAQRNRSIFHVKEDAAEEIVLAGNSEDNTGASINETTAAEGIYAEEVAATARHLRPRGVVETFYAASADSFRPGGAGINFAVASSVNDRLDLVFAGQLGAFERLETTARLRLHDRHRVSATVGAMRAPTVNGIPGGRENRIGQISARATDEWVVRDGVVVVVGFDYSRFIGDGNNADSWSPRLGFQFDANARTRLKAAYAPGGDASRAESVAVFEDNQVIFRDPAPRAVALMDGRPVMEQSRRLEFGVERVLDDRSSIEATAFFDTTDGRGVGLMSAPLNAFANEGGAEMVNVARQQGAARGMRVVYVRRINSFLKASAGYSFGRGQQLAPAEAPASPENMFQTGTFQTAAAQVDADVADGMSVRTVLRFSPRAAVFAIDPFAGQLAVYDPSLSILVTRELPNFGLPVQAEAVLDARNLLDVLTSVEDGEKLTAVNAARRSVRGGISVRF